MYNNDDDITFSFFAFLKTQHKKAQYVADGALKKQGNTKFTVLLPMDLSDGMRMDLNRISVLYVGSANKRGLFLNDKNYHKSSRTKRG